MLFSLLKPSRPGFTFPPSASPQEPGSSLEPMAEVRSQASQAGWCKAASHSLSLLGLIQSGQIPRLGPPAYPFSVPLSPASQHKRCQSPPSPAQCSPAPHGALPQPQQTQGLTAHQNRCLTSFSFPVPDIFPLP